MRKKMLFLFMSFIQIAIAQHPNAQVQLPSSANYYIFSPTCYHEIFREFNFSNSQCLKMVSSKLMGVWIILGALVSRIPQIVKIIKGRSVRSVSLNSVILQQVAQTSSMAYNIYRHNPFTLYGQSIALNLQLVIIHLLFIVFGQGQRKKSIIFFPFMTVFFLAGYFVELGLFPDYLIQNAMILQIILLLASSLSQIYEIHRMKSTGNLAFIPFGSTVLGSSVRIYTILVETEGDYLLLSSFVIALLANLYICLCFIIFQEKDRQTNKSKKE